MTEYDFAWKNSTFTLLGLSKNKAKNVGFTSLHKSPFSFFPIYLSLFASIGTISDTDKNCENPKDGYREKMIYTKKRQKREKLGYVERYIDRVPHFH